MAMDCANSAVRMRVRFGVDGGHEAYVRTYPCLPGAKAYPGWHAFGFPWWEPDAKAPFTGPGCTSEFAKRSNKFPDAQPGDHAHGLPEWYEFGLPESAFLLSGDALPPRDCEPFVALDVQDVSGDSLNADYPDCSVLQFDRDAALEVVVGHTLAQQVVRWLGFTVGEEGGSSFEGVYTVLFDGATVDVVDPRTVKVTVAASGGLPPFAGRYSQTLHTGPFPDNAPYWGGESHSTSGTTDTILPEWGFGVVHCAGTDTDSGDLTITLPSVADVLGSGWWAYVWNRNPSVGGRLLLVGTGGEELLDQGVVVSECVLDTYEEVVLVISQAEASPPWLVLRFSAAGSGSMIDGGTF